MTSPLWLLLLSMSSSSSTTTSSGRWGNSPSRNALRNVVDVYRLYLPNPDADAAQQNTSSLAASGVQCSVQPRQAERMSNQGAIRQVTEYGITFRSNVGVFVGDQLRWVDDLGVTRTIFVRGTNNLAGRGAAFYVYGDEGV